MRISSVSASHIMSTFITDSLYALRQCTKIFDWRESRFQPTFGPDRSNANKQVMFSANIQHTNVCRVSIHKFLVLARVTFGVHIPHRYAVGRALLHNFFGRHESCLQPILSTERPYV